MKTRSKIILSIIIILLVALAVLKSFQNHIKFKEYANEKLNWNFYNFCDSMMNSHAVINNAIENGYIMETDLAYLKNQYFGQLRSLDEINNISRKFKEFDFFSVNKAYDFNREYSSFYYRIDDLFENVEYDPYSIEKYQLSESDLAVFRQSYDYTAEVVGVIKNHMEYYNMFEIVIIENEETGISQLKKEYKEEYLETWPDNKAGGSANVSIDESGTVTETSLEVPRYDYPEKPLIRVNDKEWINTYEKIHLLNLDIPD